MVMEVEIERKFLVKNKPDQEPIETHVIRQGYIAREEYNTVRVREKDGEFSLTIKTKNESGGRNELEYGISSDEGLLLFSSLYNHPISKIREVYDIDGVIWELDIFEGANEGLMIVEVELDKVDQKVSIPNWVGPEVTHRQEYYNAYFADRPFNGWGVTYAELLKTTSS